MSDSTPHTDTELPDPVSGEAYDQIGPDGVPRGLLIETSEGSQELGVRGSTPRTSSAARSARSSGCPRAWLWTRPTSTSNGPTTRR